MVEIKIKSFVASSQSDTAREEYLEERIPHSSFFDISAISDQSSPYPDMLPRAEEFANHVMEVSYTTYIFHLEVHLDCTLLITMWDDRAGFTL